MIGQGQASEIHKKKTQDRRLFNDVGWSAIALVSLVVTWWLMSNRNSITYKYLGFINFLTGVLLVLSVASIMAGVWKASFRWKLLSVTMALVWLVPFVLYAMSFAGPLFYINFTW